MFEFIIVSVDNESQVLAGPFDDPKRGQAVVKEQNNLYKRLSLTKRAKLKKVRKLTEDDSVFGMILSFPNSGPRLFRKDSFVGGSYGLLAKYKEFNGQKKLLTKEEYDWREREWAKMEKYLSAYDGLFVKTRIRDFCWSDDPKSLLHFPYPSTMQPGNIAYTPSEEYGIQDRQVSISPGKYLTKEFSDLLLPEEIEECANRWVAQFGQHAVKFAKSPDEIEYVYENGPSSCMVKNKDSPEIESEFHPVRVYGAGDLAVAYLQSSFDDTIKARCLCWPERKVFGTVYGDPKLSILLEHQGFSDDPDGFIGARLLEKYENGKLIMPYMDDCLCFEWNNLGNLVISRSGFLAESASGYACVDTCCECDDPIHEEEAYTVYNGTVCETCYNNSYSVCEECYDVYNIATMYGTENGPVCEDCVDLNYTHCVICETLMDNAEFTKAQDDGICDECYIPPESENKA